MAKLARCDSTKRLLAYARELGFAAEMTKNGHLKFTKPGKSTVYFSGTPSDNRALLNGESKLRKAERGVL